MSDRIHLARSSGDGDGFARMNASRSPWLAKASELTLFHLLGLQVLGEPVHIQPFHTALFKIRHPRTVWPRQRH